MNDVGKTIWSRDHKIKGTVKTISSRLCAACGYHSCYIVKWEDGKTTKPCTKGVGYIGNDLIIL